MEVFPKLVAVKPRIPEHFMVKTVVYRNDLSDAASFNG